MIAVPAAVIGERRGGATPESKSTPRYSRREQLSADRLDRPQRRERMQSTVRDGGVPEHLAADAQQTTTKFNLVIGDDLLEKLRAEAARRRISVAAVIDEWLRIGLRVKSVLETPGGGIWVREREGAELERIWLPHS